MKNSASRKASDKVIVVAGVVGAILLFALMVFFMMRVGLNGMVGGGMRAAEGSAVSRLRTLLWAQDTVKSNHFIDRDGDGNAEYAFLQQLSGTAPLPNGKPIPTPLLMGALSQLDRSSGQTVLMDGGFCHVVYLMGPDGRGQGEHANGLERPGSIDPAGASKYWVAYAWPAQLEKSGRRAFFINQDEEIWETKNDGTGQGYAGLDKIPAFDAALPRPDLSSVPVEGQPHGDGGIWIRWKGKKARNQP